MFCEEYGMYTPRKAGVPNEATEAPAPHQKRLTWAQAAGSTLREDLGVAASL